MVNITISGLPKNIKIPKLLSYLESVVFKEVLHARLVSTMISGGFKTVTLSMRSNDARKARRLIDGVEYVYGGNVFPLQCWSEDSVGNTRHRERVEDYHSVSPPEESFSNYLDQSENPRTIRKELETIDLKIELIKKQRILVEEENKLLLEKKKAEMLKNIGPNDYENLIKFETVCGRNNPNEMANSSTANAKKKNSTKLPSFNAPCKIILAEMKQILAEYVKADNRDMLMPLIYSAIRKRLIIVLQGKNFMPPQDIVHLYRVRYPQSTDGKLLEELTNTISQSCWPEKNNGYTKNDDGDGQIVTKNEDADMSDNITQDATEDVKEENELQIVEETEVQKVEETEVQKPGDNEFQKVEKTELQKVEDIENKIAEQPQLQIVEESNKEPEKMESVEDVSINEKSLENLDNVDQFVDMDNDFDEWVENDAKDGKEAEIEEQ